MNRFHRSLSVANTSIQDIRNRIQKVAWDSLNLTPGNGNHVMIFTERMPFFSGFDYNSHTHRAIKYSSVMYFTASDTEKD